MSGQVMLGGCYMMRCSYVCDLQEGIIALLKLLKVFLLASTRQHMLLTINEFRTDYL